MTCFLYKLCKLAVCVFPATIAVRCFSPRLLLLGLFLWNLQAYGQSLKLAYYGETLVHYGLKAGMEYQLRERNKVNKQGKPVHKALLFTPTVALYHHRQNHTGLIVATELSYRRTGRTGGLFEVGLSPSFFRYFLSGTTYQVNADGSFRKVTLAGRNTFLPTFSVGLGKDLSVKHQLPLAWYTRLHLSVQYPYNASFLPRFALEAGLLKKFSTARPSNQ